VKITLILKLNEFTTQQRTYTEAERIYWCVYNCPSD